MTSGLRVKPFAKLLDNARLVKDSSDCKDTLDCHFGARCHRADDPSDECPMARIRVDEATAAQVRLDHRCRTGDSGQPRGLWPRLPSLKEAGIHDRNPRAASVVTITEPWPRITPLHLSRFGRRAQRVARRDREHMVWRGHATRQAAHREDQELPRPLRQPKKCHAAKEAVGDLSAEYPLVLSALKHAARSLSSTRSWLFGA